MVFLRSRMWDFSSFQLADMWDCFFNNELTCFLFLFANENCKNSVDKSLKCLNHSLNTFISNCSMSSSNSYFSSFAFVNICPWHDRITLWKCYQHQNWLLIIRINLQFTSKRIMFALRRYSNISYAFNIILLILSAFCFLFENWLRRHLLNESPASLSLSLSPFPLPIR